MNHLAAALLLTAAVGADPEAPKPGDKMIEEYLQRLTREQSAKFLDGATTRAEWEKKLPRLRQEYLDMLGLWPLPEKTPLKATVTGTLEHAGVVIEKLHFQSRPGLYVTGNLYRPKEPKGKLPAILYVCGHSGRGRDGNKTAFQDHGLWFANNGYVCLVIDTLQLGEIAGIHYGTYREGRWWWQALGYTPAGVECWNGVRAIDYLVSRKDVDPDRIGVTGISGGGAATIWISAADERVKVAVPVSGMSDEESYITNKVINGHCDCMFLVNTYGWQWTTIAALIAPRPLLFANSDNDKIFPMDGNRRIIERLREVYKMYDKPNLVDDHVSKGGHDYRPDLRVAVFKFINKHLKNEAGEVKDADFTPLPGKELRVFPEDKDIPTDALNGKIDETFVKRAVVKLPEEGKFDEWKKGLLKELREKSFRTFPERVPVATRGTEMDQGVSGHTHIFPTTEPGVKLDLRFNVRKVADAKTGTLIVLNPGERDVDTPEWAKAIVKDRLVHVLPPRGVDGYHSGAPDFREEPGFLGEWTRKSPPNYVERAHALLGRTADTGRVLDVAATVRLLDKEAKGTLSWTVVGRGQAGVIAAYAALFEPSITEVVIIDPPASHKDGPVFLNVLRVLDVPDALGMLAPRKLTLVNAKDKAFDKTAAIYKIAGAADKFERK
jgi:cephalosporin-C deacetylase-like acetyl esterase